MKVLELSTWTEMLGSEILDTEKLQEYLDFVVQAVKNYDPDRYSEWHHVIPKCIDKEKKFRDQGVRINGADHFRAHRKLVDCFKDSQLKAKMTYTLMRMKNNVTSHGEEVTPEEWEEAVKLQRKANSVMMSQRVGPLNFNYGRRYKLNLTEDQLRRKSQRMKGNTYSACKSPELLRRMSERFTGEGNPFYGKHHTEESKKLISEGRTGEKNPAYHKVWVTNQVIDRRVSEEEVPEMIKQGFVRGRKVSDSTRKKMSDSQSKRSRDEKGRWI